MTSRNRGGNSAPARTRGSRGSQKAHEYHRCHVVGCDSKVAPAQTCRVCNRSFHFSCANKQYPAVQCGECKGVLAEDRCCYCQKGAFVTRCKVCGIRYHPKCQEARGLRRDLFNCGREECVEEPGGGRSEPPVVNMHDTEATKRLGELPGPKTAVRKALDWNAFDHALTIAYDRCYTGQEDGEHLFESHVGRAYSYAYG